MEMKGIERRKAQEKAPINRKTKEGNRAVYDQAMKQIKENDALRSSKRDISVHASAMKDIEKKKQSGKALDAEETRALDAFKRDKRISVSDTYAKAQAGIAEEKRKVERMQPKPSIKEFVDAQRKYLEETYGSIEERQKNDTVDARSKKGATRIPKRHAIKKAFAPEIADRKKETKEPLTGAALLQSEFHEALEDFEPRIEKYIVRAQKTGEKVTKETRAEAIQKMAEQLAESIALINAKITVELRQYEKNEDVTDEERALERLAERAYIELDRFDALAAGEDREFPDPLEYEEDVMLIGLGDELNSVIPDAFLEEDPAILAAEKRDREKIVPVIPEAFLQEDPAILEAQARESREREEKELETGTFDMQDVLPTQKHEGLISLSDNDNEKATILMEGISLDSYAQDTLKTAAPKFEMPVWPKKEVSKGIDLSKNEFTLKMGKQVAEMRTEIWSKYDTSPDKNLFLSAEKGERGLKKFDSQVETLKMQDALHYRSLHDLKKLLSFSENVKKEGGELSAVDTIELGDAFEKHYRTKLEYNKTALELNQLGAMLVIYKDRRAGAETFKGLMKEAVKTASDVRNKALREMEYVDSRNADGSIQLANETADISQRKLEYFERRIQDLVDVQKNNPFGSGSSEALYLKSIHSEVLSMKLELNEILSMRDADQMISENGLDGALKDTLKGSISAESEREVAQAIAFEAGTKYDQVGHDDLITERNEIVFKYNDLRKETRDLRMKYKEYTQSLRNMNFDVHGYHSTWMNENIMSWVNKWSLRRTINTGAASDVDISGIFGFVDENNLLSDKALEEFSDKNVTFETINEIVAAYEKIGLMILKKEDQMHELSTEAFAIGEVVEQKSSGNVQLNN